MSTSAKTRSFTGKQFKEVWRDISLADWLVVVSEARPDGGWKIKGDSIEGRCPFPNHQDSSPSFNMRPAKGIAKCYGCQKGSTNPVHFVADMRGTSWSDALLYLRRKFNLKSLSAKMTDELQEQERHLIIKSSLADMFARALEFSIQALESDPNDPAFQYATACVKYLEARKIPMDLTVIKALPIGILPPLTIMKAMLGSKYSMCMPAIEKYITADYIGSLVFVYHNTPFSVGGFKIRADFLRSEGRRDIIYVKNLDESPIGLFGLGHYKALLRPSGGSGSDVVIVEGEFDALSNMANQVKSGGSYDVVLATGGSSEQYLDPLQDFGISRALLVPDAPEHGGDTIAKGWLTSNTLPMKLFTWPETVKAKDPDDAIKTYGFDVWSQHLNEIDPQSGDRKHFCFPHIWAIAALKDRLSKIDPDDVRRIKQECGEVGLALREATEQRAYISAATLATGLMPSDILSMIIGRDSTEQGFVQKIIFALKQEYSFIGSEPSKMGGTRVQFWHKEKRMIRSCNVAKPSDMFSTFNVDLGNFIDWVRDNVGTPDWAQYKRVGKATIPMSLIEQEALLKKYVEFAVTALLKELPTLDNLTELKAGSHYLEHRVNGKSHRRWVVVNGNDVYLGIPGQGIVEWRRLDGPKFGDYFINLSRPRWSNEINEAKDLIDGNSMDIKDAYNFLEDILNLGWKFQNQIEDCQYLSAAMMLNSVCAALPRQLYTIINGTRGSGKSSFLSLLTSTNYEMRVLEASFGMDSYTEAGFRKEMNNCSLGAVLDEFEDTGGDSHSRNVREILKDIRGLTSNPECRILRGNADNKESTSYTLKCQIWAAAIQYLRDEADISRFVQVHTVLAEGHPPPRITLGQRYTEEDFTRARRTITLGLFRHVPALLDEIKSLRDKYSNPAVMQELAKLAGTEVPSRYLDGVIIPAALMSLCGRDPVEFINRFVVAKSEGLKRVVQSTHTHSLFDHLMSAQFEFKPTSDADVRYTNLRNLLSSSTDRPLINNTNTGARYAEFMSPVTGEPCRWLIIVWSDAMLNLLKGVGSYRYETPLRLKQMSDSDSSMTVPNRALNLIPGGIKNYLRIGVNLNDVTVYDLTSYIAQWDNPKTELV
jgi:hypothetical protein